MADSGRTLRFAPRRERHRRPARAIEARFSCDALEFEWLPTESRTRPQHWNDAARATCARTARRSRRASRPGAKQVYYLVTDRGFAERGIRRMRVFGPRDAELK